MAENTASAAQQIAAGYATEGAALELGSVVIDGVVDPTAKVRIPFATLNRHGLVAGATGTGKTKTLQGLAGQLSDAGVPVLLADVKGDLSGMAQAGQSNPKVEQRAKDTGDDWTPTAYPVEFLSLGGTSSAVPIRATLTQFGPILLSKVLSLNDTQESTLGLIFHWADQQQLPLLDTKDLRAVIQHLTSDEGKADLKGIGGVSSATAGVILRALVNLEAAGGEDFFGEPEFVPADLLRVGPDGKGIVSLLELADQAANPRLFSTFLMWLLAELYEELPEAGDLDKPKLVFFFDEAHLLFDDAPPALLQRVEQVVRLIRSKGVGVYFCSQNPDDVPANILGQLGNRVQHALRAFTPRDQKAVKAAAETFAPNPKLDVTAAIGQLGVGEALASTLRDGGVPSPVEQVLVTTPCCRIGAIGADERNTVRQRSPVGGKYDTSVNRESAAEILARRADDKAADATAVAAGAPAKDGEGGSAWGGAVHDALFGTKRRQGMIETMGKQVVRTMGNQLGRQILRGVLGGIFGGKR